MYLKLVRQPPDGEKIKGKMMVDGKYYCETLERTSKAILPLVENVPGRTGIRIHRGSRPEHSQGCILVTFRPKYSDNPCPRHLCAPRNRELDG